MYQLICNKDIDKSQWDDVVKHSSQSQIYALSAYLDVFYPKWKGLIWRNSSGEYLAVAPIFEKNFLLFKTCYQPIFIQQSGVFCRLNVEQTPFVLELISFLKNRYFKLIYSLNVVNSEIEIENPFITKTNYILPINEFSEKQLNSNRKRELKKLAKEDLRFKESDTSEFSKKEFNHYRSKLKSVKLKHLNAINRFTKSETTRVYEIQNKNGQMLSKVLVGEFNQKVYYFIPVNYTALLKGISTKMIVDLLQYYFNKKEILDFEGGMAKNMAQFYQGFDPKAQKYKVIIK